MTQAEENIIADAWLNAIIKFLPKFSEKNQVELEKEEQIEVLKRII